MTIERFDEYRKQAQRTRLGLSVLPPLAQFSLKLAGEVGEVVDKVGKRFRGDPIEDVAIAAELGDVLWYLDAVADAIGYTLGEIAEMNVLKLEDRRLRNALWGEGDSR